MAVMDQHNQSQTSTAGARPVWPVGIAAALAVIAAVFAVLLFSGQIGVLAALGSFTVTALAVLVLASKTHAADHPLDDVHTTPRVNTTPISSGINIDDEALLGALPDPAVILDGDGIIVAFNGFSKALLGDDVVGASAFIRFRDPNVINALRMAMDTVQPQEVDYNYRGQVGRWFKLVIVPFEQMETPRAPTRFLMHMRDISESHRLEKMRSDFVGNASHELRTPLASLKGYLETLAGPAKNDEKAREQFIGIMQEQAARMERLINDLLTLSRFETGAGQVSFEPVELADVLFHVRSALSPMADSLDVRLDMDDEELLAITSSVHGSRDELIQVFENLLENGIKYGDAGSTVRVRVKMDTDLGRPVVRIAVADDGPGIAPEHIPRLVERFYRVDVQSSRNKQGTGLGLAIVKHILSRHNGRLSVQSTLGSGSIFTVILPTLGDEQIK